MSKTNPTNIEKFNDFVISKIADLGVGIDLGKVRKIRNIAKAKSDVAIAKTIQKYDQNKIHYSDIKDTSILIVEKRKELKINENE